MSLTYTGALMEVWAQITLPGKGNRGSSDVTFSVINGAGTNVQEAVWWQPRPGKQILALGNSSDTTIQTTVEFSDGEIEETTIAPHATSYIRRNRNVTVTSGGESAKLTTVGPAGALKANGYVMSNSSVAATRFASSIRFVEPQTVVQPKLFATNFRVKNSEPHLLLKNTSGSSVTVTARFRPTDGDGEPVQLPNVNIPAGAVHELNLLPLLAAQALRDDLDFVSVEIENSGASGNLIGALYSKNLNTNVTLDIPLRDSGQLRSSTGAYPIRLGGDYKTIVSITNAGSVTAQFRSVIRHSLGQYVMLPKTLEPGETARFDVKQIRNDQVLDKDGDTLPENLQAAQFGWSMIRTPSNGRLIGRSEVVSSSNHVSSSYSCPICCPDNGPIKQMPGFTVIAGNLSNVGINETWYDCYLNSVQYPSVYSGLYTLNSSVATVQMEEDGLMRADGIGAGETTWFSDPYYVWQYHRVDYDYCEDWGENETGTGPVESLPNVQVSEVGFTGDHALTKWPPPGTAIDSPDGSSPTWKSSNSPDHPVAYTRGSNITMFAKLIISPASQSRSAKLQIKNGSSVIVAKDVTISGSSVNITDLTTSSALESTVKTTTPSFTWQISYDNGTTWRSAGTSGSHKIHWTYGQPLSPTFTNLGGTSFAPLYDLAMNKACGDAGGSTSVGTIVSNLNEGVDDDVNYNPSVDLGSEHPLAAYSTPGGCQCSDQANLLRGLLRSIGIDGTTLYLWAGPNASTVRRYRVNSTQSTNGSFRILRGSHDSAAQNPHFKFHAVVSTNGTWYDPSYGLTYSSLSFDETAPNVAQQINSAFFSTQQIDTAFVCPH